MTTTSQAARQSIRHCAPEQRRKILDALGAEPLTDEQLVERTGLNPSSLRPRRGELREAGEIRDARSRRPTRSGRSAIVWELVR